MKRPDVVVAGFFLWLMAWIVLSWAAVQDDALIHLRYAENLVRSHSITYDGIHPNFGTSSLLYVGLLAAASYLVSSPGLPRLVSSVVHVALFGGLAWLLLWRTPRSSRLTSLLVLTLLALLISPSSIRWLDDGMETGLVLCGATCLAWMAFEESRRSSVNVGRYASLLLLGYLLTVLRMELAMLAGLASLAIVAGQVQGGGERTLRGIWRAALRSSHLVVGCLLAGVTVRLAMGVLLPDTALAKAEGIDAWRRVLVATEVVLASSSAVGGGLLLFWLLTLAVVGLRRRLGAATAIANLAFPVLLCLSMLRGQDIQGVRYLLWAMLFPAVWNLLALGPPGETVLPESRLQRSRLQWGLCWVFLLLLVVDLPYECKGMYHVLRTRSTTMREFEGQHLERLRGLTGVSMDIGYIGYFSRARICDMSGLVNGRAVARMSSADRVRRCAEEKPDFAFGNVNQLDALANDLAMGGWRVCSAYDFGNLHNPDTHYLVAPAAAAGDICGAAGVSTGERETIDTLLHRKDLAGSGVRGPATRDSRVRGPATRGSGVRDPATRDSGVRDPGARDSGARDSGVRDPGAQDPGARGPR